MSFSGSTYPAQAGSPQWEDAVLAAQLFCIDPFGLGGLVVRSGPGPVRDALIDLVRSLLPEGTPVRRAPLGVTDDRLLGGLDLAASLASGRPVAERGILASAHGGVVILPMAERMDAAAAARFLGALDCGRIDVERDGMTLSAPAQIGLIVLDEGLGADEQAPPALQDRLALHLDLNSVPARTLGAAAAPGRVGAARERLAAVAPAQDDLLEGLCVIAEELGLVSARTLLLALRVACAHAALQRQDAITAEDAAVAVRLVFAPRARSLPRGEAGDQPRAEPSSPEEPAPEADHAPSQDRREQDETNQNQKEMSLEMMVEAIRAALPDGVFDQVDFGSAGRNAGARGRGSGAPVRAAARGRPTGSRAGALRSGDRLNLPDTLRAAVPWQKLRSGGSAGPIQVRSQDFRVRRFAQRQEATTIFVVDASGSSAFQRLAEAKGAVELLLAKAYVTRTRVALIAFRGKGAEVLLNPTRSLTRAKRQLAELPGGGGTPLVAGIEAGLVLAAAEKAKSRTPLLVFLTDGRANVGRDGAPGRAGADADALAAARRVREAGVGAVFIDTSPRPQPDGSRFAAAMGASYALLPYVRGADLDGLVTRLAEQRR